jgi:FtsP/CotA-like multicopper oxidase with cupredoxin domain
MKIIVKSVGAFCALAFATVASAQMAGLAGPNLLPFTPSWSQTFGAAVPSVAAGTYQPNYPYPGQCRADPNNAAAFPGLPACTGGSFAPVGANACNQTVGPWLDCAAGAVKPFVPVLPALPPSFAPVPVNVKYEWEVLNPPDYTPDTVTYTGADYYEIGLHEAMGFQALAGLGAFPNPLSAAATSASLACNGAACPAHPYAAGVPDGMQWTGLRCNNPAGCTCRSDFSTTFCPVPLGAPAGSPGVIPFGAPLFTQIWGVGQINMGGTLGVALTPNPTPWSQNGYVATWPSISIRGTRGRPVVVKWQNEFPNNHVFCPHPEAADWPCAIDRTFMGVKPTMDPAIASLVAHDGVNQYGSPQQPDNSWVTHLHGGEIPPSTDGFAEKWFGNAVTGALYSPTPQFVSPAFENPSKIALKRPAGNADTYTYPMVQEEALIWFHDHTLGKTHHNVIAGPAGFFPVKDPARHGAYVNGVCTPAAGQTDCGYTWLDPLTEQRGALGIPTNDLFFAIQDRSFSEDGSINFSNGLGQPVALPVQGPNPGVAANGAVTPLACFAGGLCAAQGTTPITPGVNPQVHPVWVPEYFGDHGLVNGVLWPKKQVGPGWYRIRLVDGSDSRCWTIGFSTTQPVAATAAANGTVRNNVDFFILANDQGYLPKPILAPGRNITMCPGERYELLVNFGALPTNTVVVNGVTTRVPATNVWMTNTAAAPFPAGVTPQIAGSPFADLNTIMRFDLVAAAASVKTCATSTAAAPFAGFTWPIPPPAIGGVAPAACIPNPALIPGDATFNALEAQLRPPVGTTGVALQNWVPAGGVVRMVYLNERLDGLTALPVGMQLNGVPFEYKVTETPKANSVEVWKFVNLTVDAHPMHPHLIKNLIVSRQNFSVPNYKKALCGATTCQPGTAPGNEMFVVPDVTPFLSGAANQPAAVTSASPDGAFKDAVIARPNQVTTIVAKWEARWPASTAPTAPGTAGAAACVPAPALGTVCGMAATFSYEPVTSGPYVWHCHINSHEDSEMMRTSLVVP